MTGSFQYQPLAEGHIRLLDLLPGFEDDDICIRLSVRLLQDHHPFEALSYCWGAADYDRIIQVDGESLTVRSNLYNALLALRQKDSSRCLWVDAISINQLDVLERSQQVSMMADIYQTAIQTVAWLGLDNGGQAVKAFQWAHQLAEHPQETARSQIERASSKSTAMDHLVGKGWWERAWIVQEFALSKKLILRCGDAEIDWDTLSAGLEYGFEHGVWAPFHLGLFKDTTFDNYRALLAVTRHVESNCPANHLTKLLLALRDRKASDSRDKVFAFLGLLGDARHAIGIRPDYTTNIESTYTMAAQFILCQSDNLDLLGGCSTHELLEHKMQLPSWVPNWAVQGAIPMPYSSSTSMDGIIYHASGVSTSTISIQDQILKLKGHIYARVKTFSNTLPLLDELQWELDSSSAEESFNLELSAAHDMTDDGSVINASRQIMSILRSGGNLLRFYGNAAWERLTLIVPHLATFIVWEQYAGVDDPAKLAEYIQTLTAGRQPTNGETMEEQYEEWSNSLKPIRTLVNRGWKDSPGKFWFLAFISYVYATWSKYPKITPLLYHLQQRRLANTMSGKLCVVPSGVESGDEIWIFQGGKVPLVIRPTAEQSYKLIGEAYVHGIMNGEAYQPAACRSIEIIQSGSFALTDDGFFSHTVKPR